MDTKRDLETTKVYWSQKCSVFDVTDPHRQENILASMHHGIFTSAYVYEEVMILVKYREKTDTKNKKTVSD